MPCLCPEHTLGAPIQAPAVSAVELISGINLVTCVHGVLCPSGAYKHWGMYQPINSPEPNNLNPPEDCVVGNVTEAFSGAWGWADVNCDLELPYICRVIRGCLRLVMCAAG